MLSMYFFLSSFFGIFSAAHCNTTYIKEKTTFINSYGLVIIFEPVTFALLTKKSVKRAFNQLSAIITIKKIGILTGLVNLVMTFVGYFLYKSNTLHFQFVQQYDSLDLILRELPLDLFLGLDGSSIFFIILTGIIMPIAIISNWKSIIDNSKTYILIMLLLQMLLIIVFLILDSLGFYIFFESILPPLFLLVGFFGSDNKVVAGYYLFLYTLLGSLFMLLSILSISCLYGYGDYAALFKTKIAYSVQNLFFIGIFIAFAVKTPTIFLNIWLLKAHVESPLGGSIILAAIVLKLSLYGIVRLILPILPQITLFFTSLVFSIAVITILYASVSTLRTVDIKELIAYSSVSHAAVYILGMFSNSITGIKGAILLGLAHGFVSSGLFICVGGVLYDRASTRLISSYKGMTQLMPLFSVLFFILCLGNSGTPLTLNFIGEFMCLFGSFEKLPFAGAVACSSIVFSAAYTIYMYNRIAFGGSYSGMFKVNFIDLTKREFVLLTLLVIPTVILGIYPSCITDCLSFGLSSLIYNTPNLGLDNVVYTSGMLCLFTKPNIHYTPINTRSFTSTQVNKADRSSDESSDDSSVPPSSSDELPSPSSSADQLPSPPSSADSNSSEHSYHSERSDINSFTTITEFVIHHEDRLDTRDADFVSEYGNRGLPQEVLDKLSERWYEASDEIAGLIEGIKTYDDNPGGLAQAVRDSGLIEDVYGDVFIDLERIYRNWTEVAANTLQADASQAGPSGTSNDYNEENFPQAGPSQDPFSQPGVSGVSEAGPSSLIRERHLKHNPFTQKSEATTQGIDENAELYESLKDEALNDANAGSGKRKRTYEDDKDLQDYEGRGKKPRTYEDDKDLQDNEGSSKRKRTYEDDKDLQDYEGSGKKPRNDGPNKGNGNSGSDGPSGPSSGDSSGSGGSGGDMGSSGSTEGGTTSSRNIHDFSLDENQIFTEMDSYYFITDLNLEEFIGYWDFNLLSKFLQILPSFVQITFSLSVILSKIYNITSFGFGLGNISSNLVYASYILGLFIKPKNYNKKSNKFFSSNLPIMVSTKYSLLSKNKLLPNSSFNSM